MPSVMGFMNIHSHMASVFPRDYLRNKSDKSTKITHIISRYSIESYAIFRVNSKSIPFMPINEYRVC